MFVTGRPISVKEVFRIGLANQVVPLTNLKESCVKAAEKILSKGTLAVKYAIVAVNKGLEVELDKRCEIVTELLVRCYSTEDRVEEIKAFTGREKPHSKGK